MRDTLIIKNNIKTFIEVKQDTSHTVINNYYTYNYPSYHYEFWGLIIVLLLFSIFYYFKKSTVITNNNHNDLKTTESATNYNPGNNYNTKNENNTYNNYIPIDEFQTQDYLKYIDYDDSGLTNEKLK